MSNTKSRERHLSILGTEKQQSQGAPFNIEEIKVWKKGEKAK